MGILNLHSGLLPQYQGVMATFWAMLNNETHIGTTLHTIEDAQIDRGSIIATTQLTVDYKQSYLWHVLNLYQDGVQTMLDAVNTLAEGKPLTTTQPTADGHYYSFPTEEELQAFSRRGLALFHGSELIEFFAHYLENE
nr:formyltransferase family protein [Pleionea sp. CnH1-48]